MLEAYEEACKDYSIPKIYKRTFTNNSVTINEFAKIDFSGNLISIDNRILMKAKSQ